MSIVLLIENNVQYLSYSAVCPVLPGQCEQSVEDQCVHKQKSSVQWDLFPTKLSAKLTFGRSPGLFKKIQSCENLFWGIPANAGNSLDTGFPHFFNRTCAPTPVRLLKILSVINDAHLEISSIAGLAGRSPALSNVDQKNHWKGEGNTFPGLMQMAVQDLDESMSI